MEMTIKQLAVELGVSKTTISKVISQLGFQNTLRKVGNKYILSETQISFASKNANFASKNANFASKNANFASKNANFASKNRNIATITSRRAKFAFERTIIHIG